MNRARLVPGLLLLLLPVGCVSMTPPLASRAPLIVVEEEADGEHWRATWQLSEPTRELLFQRPASGFRSAVFEVLTPGFAFAKKGDLEVLRTSGAPAQSITVRFPEYSRPMRKEYEFFRSFSDGSVALYTGHLVARPLTDDDPEDCEGCFIRSFELRARPDVPVIVEGRVMQSPVAWTDEREQGTYVYFGAIEPVETPEMISIVDPALPDWLLKETKDALPALFDLYTQRFGVALPERPTILFSYSNDRQSGYWSGGGTLPGQIQLTVGGTGWDSRSEEAMLNLFHFLAHEAVHLWNGQIVNYPDSEDSWMHEGSADALAGRTLLEIGLIDEARFLDYQTAALNECLRGTFALREAARRGDVFLYYACGNMIALLTEQTTPDHDLFDFWRELVDRALDSGHYHADDYFDVWADLGGDPREIEALREFIQVEGGSGRIVELLQRSGVTIVKDPNPPQTYGQSFSRQALLVLMKEQCRGNHGFNASQRGFELDDPLDCGPIPAGQYVTMIGGHDVLRQGHRTWDVLYDRCGTSRSVEVQLSGNDGTITELELPCSSEVSPRSEYVRITGR